MFKPGMTIAESRAAMEAAFRKPGGPYATSLPFDRLRAEELVRVFCDLAAYPEGDQTPADWRGFHGERVLDVGCGEGGTCTYIPEEFRRLYTGVEISQTAVERARANFPGANYVCCAAEEFHTTEKYTLATCIEAIEHWVSPQTIMPAIRNALRDGGYLVLTTPNADSLHLRMADKLGLPRVKCCHEHLKEWHFNELIHFVEAFGFKRVRSAGVAVYPYWALEARLGPAIRGLTDHDPQVNEWMISLGRTADPQLCFNQAHAFKAV